MDVLLTIAIPTGDSLKSETVKSLFNATQNLDFPVRLDIINSCYIHDARNKLVEKAIQSHSTHLLFIDSDMAFPEFAIKRLVDWDKEIIGGLYYRRELPLTPTILVEDSSGLVVPDKWDETQPFKVFAVATGFMMIKTSVFEKLKPPFFFFNLYKNRMLGEDAYFCMKAKKAGIDVWCDPNLQVKHVGNYSY